MYLDFRDALERIGKETLSDRYENLFEMYQQLTGENAYAQPMRIYPAPHYTMGGLWVDYSLMTTVPGLFAIGEANFSDHGANRLGASALMQGLADGYFILPNTIGDFLGAHRPPPISDDHPEFRRVEAEAHERLARLLRVQGRRTVASFHHELGALMWHDCGMERSADGLRRALARIPEIREEFWSNVLVPGSSGDINQPLEQAARVADYLEFAELMCRDALAREESCGAHFRTEHQTPDGEPARDDERFAYTAAWQYRGEAQPAAMHKEPLTFEYAKPSQRSYK